MRWEWTVKAAIAALLLLAPARAIAAPVFDGGGPTSASFTMFPFWQKIINDMQNVGVASLTPASFVTTPGAPAAPPPPPPCANERTCAPPQWLSFLDTLRGQDRLAQLQAVNAWANAKPYVEDWDNWHVSDYWETPGEFIAHGGDCEDYAIAKYYSLVRLGFPEQDLKIVIVDDHPHHVFHAVLAAQLNGTVWLLDNQLPQMVAMDTAVQYTPVYALNQEGWWLLTNPVIRLAGLTITTAPAAIR